MVGGGIIHVLEVNNVNITYRYRPRRRQTSHTVNMNMLASAMQGHAAMGVADLVLLTSRFRAIPAFLPILHFFRPEFWQSGRVHNGPLACMASLH